MQDQLAVVIILCTAMVTGAGVVLLAPITRRLGAYFDAMAQARLRAPAEGELARIREVLSSIDGRLDNIEERQDFAEALISAADPKMLNVPGPRAERN